MFSFVSFASFVVVDATKIEKHSSLSAHPGDLSCRRGAAGQTSPRRATPRRISATSRYVGMSRGLGERRIVERKYGTERFECAAVTLVAELDAEHIERDTLFGRRLAIDSESEAGLRIDESSNQPG
jgi:hypothetical protein